MAIHWRSLVNKLRFSVTLLKLVINFSHDWERGQVTHLYNGLFIGLSGVAGNSRSGCKSKADIEAAGCMDVL